MNHQQIFFSLIACSILLLPEVGVGLEANALEVVDASDRVVTASAVRTVVGWGWNAYEPLNVPEDIGDVEQVAACFYNSITVQADGSVKVWGRNTSSVHSTLDVPEDLGRCLAVSGGSGHVLALKEDRTVVAWGQNVLKQTEVPYKLRDVVSVAAGGWHSVALLANGRIVSWGDGAAGQRPIPAGARNAIAITAGAGNIAVLKRSGRVMSWGNAWTGTSRIPRGLSDVIAIDAGSTHLLALKRDGGVVAWGRNVDGECDVPSGLGDVEFVSGGAYHSLALKRDGTVVAWGEKGYSVPLATAVPPALSGVIAIASGNGFSLALVEPGNDFGSRQLGEIRHHHLFVNNPGNVPYQGISAVLEGDDADQFVLQPPPEVTLLGESKLPFTLSFAPTRLGSASATLKIYSSAPDSPLILPIKGVGSFRATATNASTPKSNFTYARLRLERQTGLLLQRITFQNTSGFELQGLKLILSGVMPGVQVYGTREGELPASLEVIYSQPIAASEVISFDLVYFDPRRRAAALITPVIKAEALLERVPDSLPVTGTTVNSLRVHDSPRGPTLEWSATAGTTYVVEYSEDDGATWLSTTHRLIATNSRMFWLDRGQPETVSKPIGLPNRVGGRFYRVKRL